MDSVKVYMYFLRFNAEDLHVFYDEYGIAAVAYNGPHQALHNDQIIQHCFSEGYIDRSEDTALILYAYTDDPVLAKSFELSRDSHLFVKKTVKMTGEEFTRLKRYKEAKLVMYEMIIGPDKYLNVVVTDFEAVKVAEMDDDLIASELMVSEDIVYFMPLENGIQFQDDLFSESLFRALQVFHFKEYMGEDSAPPLESTTLVNEWNLFYAYFSETLNWK